MHKALLKISLIIFANLLAFVCIWLILDALFGTGWIAILASILVSLPVLGMIIYFKVGDILAELQKITEK
jgi:hypothetical protein